jgi:hypothetical protein
MPPEGGSIRELGEDTVELELTQAEQLELSRAAEGALAQRAPGDPAYDAFVYARTRRVDLAGTVTFVALACGLTAALAWHARLAPPDAREPPLASATRPATTAAARPMMAVLQIPNPFDASEIFELPPNTSEADAREAIADVLLQRARERHEHGLLPHSNSHHRHDLAQPVRPTDVFVTKLLSPPDRFSDAASTRNGTPE